MNHKLESRFLGEISTTSDIKPQILKSPLMRVKEESKKAVLKLKVQKTKIMTSIPITSWQIDGEKVEMMLCHPAYLIYMQGTLWKMLG